MQEKDSSFLHETKSPYLDWELFEKFDIPLGTSERNNLLIVVKNINDGVGDYIHAKEFSIWIKERLAGKNYKIGFLLQKDTVPDKSSEKNARFVINDLERNWHSFCDTYWVAPAKESKTDAELESWLEEGHNSVLKPFIENACGVLAISTMVDSSIAKFLLSCLDQYKISMVKCFQYGEDSDATIDYAKRFQQLYMGLPAEEDSVTDGLKIYSEAVSPSPTATLLEIGHTEQAFVQQLLNSQEEISEQSAQQYFAYHHFMPGYLQDRYMATLFVLSHFYAHRLAGSTKICDFFIPSNVVDLDTITALAESMRLGTPEKIQFISESQEVQPFNPTTALRIFALRISSDSLYKKCYSLTEDGAGASGDSSISLVFSSYHLPFIAYKRGVIGEEFCKHQLLGFLQTLRQDLAPTHPLQQGMGQLIEYFELTFSISEEQLNSFDEASWIEIISKIAPYLVSEEVKIAWYYVRDKIHQKYNIFPKLELVIKYMTNFPSIDNQLELNQLFLNTYEIKQLIAEGWVKVDDIDIMDITAIDNLFMLSHSTLSDERSPFLINPIVFQILPFIAMAERIDDIDKWIKQNPLGLMIMQIPFINILSLLKIIDITKQGVVNNEFDFIETVIFDWHKNKDLFLENIRFIRAKEIIFTLLIECFEKALEIGRMDINIKVENLLNQLAEAYPQQENIKCLLHRLSHKNTISVPSSRQGFFDAMDLDESEEPNKVNFKPD